MLNFNRQLRLLFLVAIGLLVAPRFSEADPLSKIEFVLGAYSLDASSATGSGKASGFGSYRAGYRRALLDNLEGMISYSIFTSTITGGDLGYGPDVGLVYYPLSNAQPSEIRTGKLDLFLTQTWRPFAGVHFHQRQFQSVASSYAGFSLSVGSDFYYNKDLGLKAEGRFMNLNGPSEAKATFFDVLFGGVIYY